LASGRYPELAGEGRHARSAKARLVKTAQLVTKARRLAQQGRAPAYHEEPDATEGDWIDSVTDFLILESGGTLTEAALARWPVDRMCRLADRMIALRKARTQAASSVAGRAAMLASSGMI
jgi:hypothetical protein